MEGFIANLNMGMIASDGMQRFWELTVPTAAWVLRFVMIPLGIAVLLRCLVSLFGERNTPDTWGYLSLSNGVRYPLNHWESLLGRARSADVVLDFPSVSRSHAAILRDDKGEWRLFPLEAKNGTAHNGERLAGAVALHTGDVISLGGLELYFYSITDEERAQKQSVKVHKRTLSPHKTLATLTFFQGLMLLQCLLAVNPAEVFQVVVCFFILSGAMWCLYMVYRVFQRTAFEVETIAFFLCTLSFGITTAYSPKALLTQTLCVVLGLCVFLVLSLALRDIRMAVSLRWPVAVCAGLLLTFNLLLGQRIFGAKNWIEIGPFSVQPSEFIKIAFIIASAATLDRLFANRNLIFTTLFAGFCVGCLALMSDFGTAMVFFVAFLVVAFLRSGNLGFLVMMGVGAGLGCGIVLQFKPYIAGRFEAWRHVWEYASGVGYQQTRTMSAIASGGLFGKSPEDVFLKNVGAANTDLVFGVVSESFGFLLAMSAVLCIVTLTVFAVKCTGTARSSYYAIASCTAASMLAFQTCLNVFGSVDLLPLTGVTFPFLSVGGSSMISCWGLLAFIKAADSRKNASFTAKRPKFVGTRGFLWRKEDTLATAMSGDDAEVGWEDRSRWEDFPDIPEEIWNRDEDGEVRP